MGGYTLASMACWYSGSDPPWSLIDLPQNALEPAGYRLSGALCSCGGPLTKGVVKLDHSIVWYWKTLLKIGPVLIVCFTFARNSFKVIES